MAHNVCVLDEMLHRAVPVQTYLTKLDSKTKTKYDNRRQSYTLNQDILEALKQYIDKFIVVAICASWCKDCISNIPVLDLIREVTGLQVMVLGGVKTDPLNLKRQWAVPPSPPEVDSLCITHIPTILIFTHDGQEVGRIIENPIITPTLEEELLHYFSENNE